MEAGLDSQDVRGGAGQAVRGPPLNLVPEDRKFSCHVSGGLECVRAVAKDREEER